MSGDFRIFKLDANQQTEVRSFEFDDLKKSGPLTDGSFQASQRNQAKIQAQNRAAVNQDAADVAQGKKGRRFAIDPLLEGTMSVEEETQRVIDDRVNARLAEVEAQAREDAREAGYQEGLATGHQEATDAFQLEAHALTSRIDAWITACEESKTEIYAANEKYLIEVIYRMGKMILLRELSQDKDQIKRLVQDLIEKTPARDHIRVLVGNEDFDAVIGMKAELKEKFANLKNFSIEPSQHLKHGGCVIETNWGVTDATLETQLENVYQALSGNTTELPAADIASVK